MPKSETVQIKLVLSTASRLKTHNAILESLGLRRVGDVTVQPVNAATEGKIKKIIHMIEVTR